MSNQHEWMPPNADPERHRWGRQRLFQQTSLLYNTRSMADTNRLTPNSIVLLSTLQPDGEKHPVATPSRQLCTVLRFSKTDGQLVGDSTVHYLPNHEPGTPCYAVVERTGEGEEQTTKVSTGTDEWLVFNHNDAAFATYQHLRGLCIGEDMLNGLGLNPDGTDRNGGWPEGWPEQAVTLLTTQEQPPAELNSTARGEINDILREQKFE